MRSVLSLGGDYGPVEEVAGYGTSPSQFWKLQFPVNSATVELQSQMPMLGLALLGTNVHQPGLE